jgi:hypothetical protein
MVDLTNSFKAADKLRKCSQNALRLRLAASDQRRNDSLRLLIKFVKLSSVM